MAEGVLFFRRGLSTAGVHRTLGKTNSVHPMNDMHCDNTSPLWYDNYHLPDGRFTFKPFLSLGLVSWATLVLPSSYLRLALSFLSRPLSA